MKIPYVLSEDAVVENEQGAVVWIVDKNNHVHPKSVKTGNRKDGRIEVIEGLDGSERIVAKPKELTDDQAVKLSE